MPNVHLERMWPQWPAYEVPEISELPLIMALTLQCKNVDRNISYVLVKILYTSILSPLLLLNDKGADVKTPNDAVTAAKVAG